MVNGGGEEDRAAKETNRKYRTVDNNQSEGRKAKEQTEIRQKIPARKETNKTNRGNNINTNIKENTTQKSADKTTQGKYTTSI